MKFCKQFNRTLTALACAVAALPAMATDVAVNADWGGGYGVVNVNFNGKSYSNEAAIGIQLTHGGQTFESFCMEFDQIVYTGTTVNYTVSSYTNDAFSRLFAVAGFNSADSSHDSVNTVDKKTALQLAVWEALYDGLGGSFSSGNFSVTSSSSANALTLAQSYLSAAAALTSSQYTTTTLYRYSSAQYQDQITTMGPSSVAGVSGVSAVPEPETAFLWLGGLAGVAALRRRQRRA